MKKFIALMAAAIMIISVPSYGNVLENERKISAFPGAEGGGKYTSGGRGGEVYIVTTLEDYDPETEEPIKGSFRDAVSQDNRIIVFNTGGVIHLKNRLNITKRNNLTVAGQTAPGNGITIYGFETNLSNSNNIIMRYIRFRPGAENVLSGDSMDSIWGRSMKDIMIDHLSCSWSTDETMSLYRAENMTVQWSVIAESLTMSGHTKGRHGYGAITGGVNTTYHHNLYANHTSRNPRFGGGTVEADDNDHIACFDFRNNVIYNWGFNTGYGGGRAEQNYVYNYMKPGPGTRNGVIDRIIDCGEKNKPGWFYVNGNVLEGNEEVSKDNNKGIYISKDNKPFTTIVNNEFEMEGTKPENLHTDTPEGAYELVLARAGATLPKRDALDARIIQSVEDNTGYFVNRHEEVGGLPYTDAVYRNDDFDRDADGIPDEWEKEHGLNPLNPSDSMLISDNGYANIENYFNSLVDMKYEPSNPYISLENPENNQQFAEDENIILSVKTDDNVKKVEFYCNDSVIGTDCEAPFEMRLKGLKDGTYNISAKAINEKGEQTQSAAHKIHINAKTDLGNWQSTDIGEPGIAGSAALIDGKLTVKGSGKISGEKDSLHFVYQKVKGDFDIITKVNSITPVDNHAFSGIIARNSLMPESGSVNLGLCHTKAYEWKETNTETGKTTTYYRNPFSVYLCGRNEDKGEMPDLAENLDSVEKAQESGVQILRDIEFKDGLDFKGYYLRLIRKGNQFTAFASPDGSKWTKVGSKFTKMNDELYVGLGADGNKVDNRFDNLNTAVFSNIKIK